MGVANGWASPANGTGQAVSGGSLTWTLSQDQYGYNTNATTDIFTATVDANKSMTVTFHLDANAYFGGIVYVFRNSGGLGASTGAVVANATPSKVLTTTSANSAIVFIVADWSALDGTGRAFLSNPGAYIEKVYYTLSGEYTVYSGYHASASDPGPCTIGMTAPTNQTYSMAVIEVKGK